MATIDSREAINRLIAGNGRTDPDDQPVVKIVQYLNYERATCWGIVFENESPAMQIRYEIETDYVRNPVVIWRREVK